MLRRIVANTNARIDRGDPPAVTGGHTSRKNQIIIVRQDGTRVVLPGTQELDQPPVLGYAAGFKMGKHNGSSCIFADWYIHKEHANLIKTLPYRSAERLESPDGNGAHDVIDRIAALKSPPERDLGTMIAYEKGDRSGYADRSGVKRIAYERPCYGGSCAPARPIPTPTTTNRSNHLMTNQTSNTLRRIAYEAALDAGADMDRIMNQYERLKQLRGIGIHVPDDELERIALLDEDKFASEFENVRTCYARNTVRPLSRSWFRDPADADDCARAVEYSTNYDMPYSEAKRLVSQARQYAGTAKCSQAQAERRILYEKGYGATTSQSDDGTAVVSRRVSLAGNKNATPRLDPPRRPEMDHASNVALEPPRVVGAGEDFIITELAPDPPPKQAPMNPVARHMMAIQMAFHQGCSYDEAVRIIAANELGDKSLGMPNEVSFPNTTDQSLASGDGFSLGQRPVHA